MELLVFSGSARSNALMALRQRARRRLRRRGQTHGRVQRVGEEGAPDPDRADRLDEGCGKLTINLITVHAQDHLMNAMVIRDLADDMIELYRRQSPTEGRP